MKQILLGVCIVMLARGRTELSSWPCLSDDGGAVHLADPLQGVWGPMVWQSDSASALSPEPLFLARTATGTDMGVTGHLLRHLLRVVRPTVLHA